MSTRIPAALQHPFCLRFFEPGARTVHAHKSNAPALSPTLETRSLAKSGAKPIATLAIAPSRLYTAARRKPRDDVAWGLFRLISEQRFR